MNRTIYIPMGVTKSPTTSDEAAKKRKELRDKLLRGEEVVVSQEGEVGGKQDKQKNKDQPAIVVPDGKLAQQQGPPSEDAAARKRRELREKLLRGEEVVVTQQGEVKKKSEAKPEEPTIVVPEGKLAASFYWYQRDPELLEEEKAAMNHYFPQFTMDKLSDGRLTWVGHLSPKNVRANAKWHLQVIYDNNHPHNNSYGGSIKIYSVDPDLDQIAKELGGIPHTLRDSSGHLHLCTARGQDVKARVEHSTSAASALSWAAKWITAFELWIAGDLRTDEFAGENI